MSEAQKATVDKLVMMGGVLDDKISAGSLVIVWLNGHCFMVDKQGEIEEL